MRRLEIVVLNWNGLEDVTRCLESLRRLRPRADLEIGVRLVDNGSRDGSAERLPERFPEARFQVLPENLRFAGGNNAGVRAALAEGADYVLLLNNDTEVDENLVVDLFDEVERSPGAGLWGPLITDAAGRVWFGGGGVSLAWGWTWHRGLGEAPASRSRTAGATGYLTGCCLLVARSVFERVGLLDEGYYLYGEDADFSLRARAAGFRPRFVPRARLTHFVSSSSGGSVNPFKAYHRTRAGLRLFGRHARGWRRATWRLGFLLFVAAQSLVWLARGVPAAGVAAWQALADAARGIPPGRRFPAPGAAPGAVPGARPEGGLR